MIHSLQVFNMVLNLDSYDLVWMKQYNPEKQESTTLDFVSLKNVNNRKSSDGL